MMILACGGEMKAFTAFYISVDETLGALWLSHLLINGFSIYQPPLCLENQMVQRLAVGGADLS